MSTNRGRDKEDAHMYTIEYYSAIKRNEVMPFAETWMDLKPVIQSEVSKREKQISHINTYMWSLGKLFK